MEVGAAFQHQLVVQELQLLGTDITPETAKLCAVRDTFISVQGTADQLSKAIRQKIASIVEIHQLRHACKGTGTSKGT